MTKFGEHELINVLALVISRNNLQEAHGEDVIGVLMKCGAFVALDEGPALADLATKIEWAMVELNVA